MADLMSCLKQLSGFSSGTHLQTKTSDSSRSNNGLTVSERLQCCIVAFKIMKSNLDALNVDLQDFFVQLYNLLLEYRPHRFLSLSTPPLFLHYVCLCSNCCFGRELRPLNVLLFTFYFVLYQVPQVIGF